MWTELDKYTGYFINEKGDVFSTQHNSLIRIELHKKYLCVRITMNGVRRREKIHRLLAQTFIDNPNNYLQVRHLNDDPADNSLENLAWGNASHNAIDKFKNGYKITEEQRKKMSEAKKGKTGYWAGKTFSDDHKQKLSIKKIGNENARKQ